MPSQSLCLETSRLRLRCPSEADRASFAALNAHPEVMKDLGGSISRDESDRKLDHYSTTFSQYGYGRWMIENRDGNFIGYAGVMPSHAEHPLGVHDEVGWRLIRSAWGNGYATEAAQAALDDVFARVGLTEVVAYTSPDNSKSQAVMVRLNLIRDSSRDFTVHHEKVGDWSGLVWVARAPSHLPRFPTQAASSPVSPAT